MMTPALRSFLLRMGSAIPQENPASWGQKGLPVVAAAVGKAILTGLAAGAATSAVNKVISTVLPGEQPRWPAGDTEGRGGQFAPSGEATGSVAEATGHAIGHQVGHGVVERFLGPSQPTNAVSPHEGKAAKQADFVKRLGKAKSRDEIMQAVTKSGLELADIKEMYGLRSKVENVTGRSAERAELAVVRELWRKHAPLRSQKG